MFLLVIINENREVSKIGTYDTEEDAEKKALDHFFYEATSHFYYLRRSLFINDELAKGIGLTLSQIGRDV